MICAQVCPWSNCETAMTKYVEYLQRVDSVMCLRDMRPYAKRCISGPQLISPTFRRFTTTSTCMPILTPHTPRITHWVTKLRDIKPVESHLYGTFFLRRLVDEQPVLGSSKQRGVPYKWGSACPTSVLIFIPSCKLCGLPDQLNYRRVADGCISLARCTHKPGSRSGYTRPDAHTCLVNPDKVEMALDTASQRAVYAHVRDPSFEAFAI